MSSRELGIGGDGDRGRRPRVLRFRGGPRIPACLPNRDSVQKWRRAGGLAAKGPNAPCDGRSWRDDEDVCGAADVPDGPQGLRPRRGRPPPGARVSRWFTQTDAAKALREERERIEERERAAAEREASAERSLEGVRLEAEATIEGAHRRAEAEERAARADREAAARGARRGARGGRADPRAGVRRRRRDPASAPRASARRSWTPRGSRPRRPRSCARPACRRARPRSREP